MASKHVGWGHDRSQDGRGKELRVMTAYVLVQTATQDGGIARRLREVPGIVFAEDVRGPYDALALARSDAMGDTFQAILEQIRDLPGVTHALAAPVAREPVGMPSSNAA
jgi:Lrp/AsnC ligand binding domain